MDFGFATDDQYNVYDRGEEEGTVALCNLEMPVMGIKEKIARIFIKILASSSDYMEQTVLKQTEVAEKLVFLHSDLDLWILEAKSLPNMDLVSERMSRWMFYNVKDNDVLGVELIGVVDIPIEKILGGNTVNGWFPVVGPYGNPLKPYPELHLSLKFRPVAENPLYKDGVGAGPDYSGVPNSYFPLRKGGSVTLYQDAHVPNQMLPEILLDGGEVFQQGKCWEDICHAILEAHHLIYIVGWSVNHTVKLVREPTKPLPTGGELSLGELLKFKSQEGVRVAMMIWDDKTSHDNFLFKTVVGTLFTHHQKCILVDTQASRNNRKITAFIGGLDLCDGHYDTPEHRLFCDLDSVFANDFHNPTFPSRVRGPRQPWHDLHCRIDGPAAHDILTNFEQRWRKATKWKDIGIKKVTRWYDDALINLDRMSWILTPAASNDENVRVSKEGDPENWHVQVFGSFDSGSVKGFPKVVKEAEKQNLMCGKNLKIDRSMHAAYVKAIRSAQHFIYIENQYFLESSYYWPSYKNAGADNLVPMELALKIASKIRENKCFSVYVVIPMWPEGVPTSASMQEILFWQSAAFNSGAKQRIIRMVEMPVDPLEPPKFKHKRVPKASGSPVPVMQSPPRPVTVKDQQDWKIPPCISNWKNPKGYTIPLDKRLAADGRGLQEVQINDNFAKLSESLYVTEQKAREAVAMRSKVQKEMFMKEKDRKEQELQAVAQKARSERTGGSGPPPSSTITVDRSMMDGDDMRIDHERVKEREREPPKESRDDREERLGHEKIREERGRERRLGAKDAAMGKKSKITRDRDRGISEKVALGMANTGAGRGGEVMYDQSLDKPTRDTDTDTYGGADEQLEKVIKTDRFKPDKGIAGANERAGPRDKSVEFEKQVEEADPFGLDHFLTEVKKGKKPMDKVGSGGTMKASAGSSMLCGGDWWWYVDWCVSRVWTGLEYMVVGGLVVTSVCGGDWWCGGDCCVVAAATSRMFHSHSNSAFNCFSSLAHCPASLSRRAEEGLATVFDVLT
ncbi:hypothetical protein IFM89_001160 [Coptis chinensis]|uniref:phospholipase D n=1 Tax=Coptis chinensis TaxID=261450 RepID=A0A835ILG4_9MAGN|nr:hypothetical protein IFM89_001160 [Coptis chinensis]